MNIHSLKHWLLMVLLLPLITYPAAQSHSKTTQKRTTQMLLWGVTIVSGALIATSLILHYRQRIKTQKAIDVKKAEEATRLAAEKERLADEKLKATSQRIAQQAAEQKRKTDEAKKQKEDAARLAAEKERLAQEETKLKEGAAVQAFAEAEQKRKPDEAHADKKRVADLTTPTESDLLCPMEAIDPNELNKFLKQFGYTSILLGDSGYFQISISESNTQSPYGELDNFFCELYKTLGRSAQDSQKKLASLDIYRASLGYSLYLFPLKKDLHSVFYTLLNTIKTDPLLKDNIQTIYIFKTACLFGTDHEFIIEIEPQLGQRSAQLVLRKLYSLRKLLPIPTKNRDYTTIYRPIKDHEHPLNVVCWYSQGRNRKEYTSYLEADSIHFKEKFLLTPVGLSLFQDIIEAQQERAQWMRAETIFPTTYHLRHPATGEL